MGLNFTVASLSASMRTSSSVAIASISGTMKSGCSFSTSARGAAARRDCGGEGWGTWPVLALAARLSRGRAGHADRERESPEDRSLRLHAERFTGGGGAVYVAAVVADRMELEDQYASLIATFAAESSRMWRHVASPHVVNKNKGATHRGDRRMRRADATF